MEKKLKVLIADNSNQFATQCQKRVGNAGLRSFNDGK